MRVSELAKDLKPYIVPWLREASVTVGTGGLSAHALNGPYHTGTLAESQAPWAVTDSEFSAHTSNPDAHHAKQHSITDGAHHTVTGSAWDVVGLSAANTLGVLGSSSNPGATEKLLRTASDGSITLRALLSSQSTDGGAILQGIVDIDNSYARAFIGHNAQWSPSTNLWTFDWIGANDGSGFLLTNNAGSIDLIFHSSSGGTGRTMTHAEFTAGKKFSFAKEGTLTAATTFVSGFTGSGLRLDDGVATAGKTTLELDEMIVRGRMRVYELLIHQIRATNGSLFVSGVGKVKTVSGSGPYTITTDTDHGFATNDLIRAQRFTGSGVWQSNMQVTGVSSTTVFTATLTSGDAPAVGMEFVRLGNTTDTSRQGSIYLTADDTYAPYIDILDGVASFAEWGAATKIKVRLGRLDGITDVTLNPTGYGLYSQNAFLSGTVSAAGDVVRLDATGARIKAGTGSSYASLNAYRFLNAGGVELGGVYARDYSSSYYVGLATTGDSTHTPATQVTSRGGTAVGGSAQVYLDATSQNAAKASNILLDVTNSASYILFGAADYAQFNMETRSIGGHRPLTDLGANLGSATYRWGVVYANQVIAATISGSTMSGAEWEYTGSMVIDANSASNTTVSIVNQGAGLASLDVENSITLGGTVDGVDVAAFKSSYDTHVITYNNHAANVNAHHAQSHVLATTGGLGGDHTVSGLTAGYVLRATGATTAQFMGLTSGDIVTALGYTPANRAGDAFTGAVTITSNTEGTGSGNQTYQLGVGKSGAGFVQIGTHSGYPALSGQGTGSSYRLLLNPENGGNVGVGTLSPSYKLDVNGTGRFAGALLVQPASNVISAFEVRDATGIPVFSVDTLNFRAGFGRSDPQAKFHIYTSADEILRLESSSATGNPFISWFQSGTRRSFVQHNDTGDTLIVASEYGPISLKTHTAGGAVERMQIEAAGNVYVVNKVGIGISPTYPLDISGTSLYVRYANTGTTQYSHATLILSNAEVTDAHKRWDIIASKDSAGAATGNTSFHIRRRNDGGTEVITPIVVNGAGDVVLNAGYSAGSQTYGNVGVKMTPNASYALDVSGAMRASISVTSPLFTAASGNVTVSAPATLYLNAGAANTVDLQVAGVSQWTASDARLNPRSTVVMDVGDYNRKLRSLYAAELYVETLVAQDVMATIGGRVMVAPTTTLIADLSNSAPSALYTNLISYWKLDEASGNRADSKGSNTLTDTNTVTSIAGKQSNAAVFTKANSEYLTVADNSSLSVGDIDFYMACWIYPTLDDAADQYIAAKAGSSGNRAWRLWIDWTANQIKFQVYNSSDTATTVTASTFGTISVNTWYFVEAWHDSVGNVIGVSVNTTSNTTAHTTGVKDDTGPFQLGAANGASFYQGYIDEFGFWKYMPASGDRTFLYNSGAGRTYANISDWTTIDVKHNSLTAGTYIYMQAAPGGVAQIEALQVTASASAVTGGYRYPVIRNLDGTGNNTWVAGDAVVSLGSAVGQGYIDLTSTSTIHSQLGPTITIFSRTATTAWNSVKPVVTMGNLRSFVDYVADEYGTGAGNDLTLTPATGFAGYTIDRTNGLRLFNTELKLYSGATESVRLNNSVGLRFVTGSGLLNKINWYNVADGYDQASIGTTLSGGTSTLTINVNARDPGTGAFSGQAQVIVSNSVTASSIKLLANDGSVGGPNYYLMVANTGVTVGSGLGLTFASTAQTVLNFAQSNWYLGAISNTDPLINFDSNDYMYYARSANTLSMIIGGASILQATSSTLLVAPQAANASGNLQIYSADHGNTYGPWLHIGRNTYSSAPRAGWIRLQRKSGTGGDLWVDDSGNLRIGADTTSATDTGGTVVGTQTSSLDSKIIMGPAPSAAYAIAHVVQAARTALRQFQYKSGAFNHQIFDGIITDYAPRYGMDRDAAHPAGKSLNEIQLFSDLLLSVEWLYDRVQQLEAQCDRS